jgi:cytochrome c peroxidase
MLLVSGLVMPETVRVASAAPGGLKPLNTVAIPLPRNLKAFVRNRDAAIALGKALFWDQQVGGDGIQACASCHFQAGADVRIKNTMHPGPNNTFDTVPADATLNGGLFPNSTDDIAGSQGVPKSVFIGLSGGPVDNCTEAPDSIFNVGGANVRQVTGRNAPFTANAIFYYRNFWDGRANNVFNGSTPNGPSEEFATVLKVIGGVPTPVFVKIGNASLASQAVGPPNNPVEMACSGRTFPQIGKKMLGLKPLGLQLVDPTDSVLGRYSLSPEKGLNVTYRQLIRKAFVGAWWNSNAVVNGFSVMENNFSLYWGLSLMLYQSTLVSDDTPVDRYLAGNTAALNAKEKAGMDVFTGEGRCTQCHKNAELTLASVKGTGGNPRKGFFNIGVRPTAEDGGDVLQPGSGFFKTPGLRNVELTGPYFHNGGMATLRQVVDFYDRGGDFPDKFTNTHIRQLKLTETEKNNLVAFLVALTDERVRFEKAPFDHPSLEVPNMEPLPAVGAAGRATPLKTFLGLSPFTP